METMIIQCCWKRFFCRFLWVMFIILIGYGHATAAQTAKREKQEAPQYTISGRDPKAFADAAAMFAPSKQKVLEESAARAILDDLDKAVQDGASWSPKLWESLERLRGARMSQPLSLQLQQTAAKMMLSAKKPSQAEAIAATQAFKEGNLQYEAGKFYKAIESYRAALGKDPYFWDAWNNMALAEMHQNNDLLALFQFAALGKNAPHYAGALINLSVCLERLGLSQEASKTADTAVRKFSQMPMAQYNKAWFENFRGNYVSSQQHLSLSLKSVPDYSNAKWLKTINKMEAGNSLESDDLKSLPPGEQTQGIPKIIKRPVIEASADAYAGNTLVTKIPKGNQLVISDKSGDWLAVYWPMNGVKRRLWIQPSTLGGNPGGL
jgi:tetratricopeptide (TPR) repeat protein